MAGPARAAPGSQSATRTPTPTPTLPALPTPPPDAAVVAVLDLDVLNGPGETFATLGGLPYGALVYPKARTQDGQWVQVDYAGQEGWLRRPLVVMGFDVFELPVPESLQTPTLTASPTALTLTPEGTPTSEETPATVSPTLSLLEMAEPTRTQTPSVESAGATTQQPAATATEVDSAQPAPAAGFDVERVGLVAAALLGIMISAGYLLNRRTSERYAQKGFAVEHCLACREGTLTLHGRGRSHWVVRCDNCRSVLRQVRRGSWRYAVDPLPDEEFAKRYNGKVLSEAALIELARERFSGRPVFKK